MELELSEGFAEQCFSLGFKMDSGQFFEKAYPDSNAFNDYRKLEEIIDQIDNITLLSATIFSKWRYITYWSYGEQLLSLDNRAWFLITFSRSVELSSEQRYSSLDFNSNKSYRDQASIENDISYEHNQIERIFIAYNRISKQKNTSESNIEIDIDIDIDWEMIEFINEYSGVNSKKLNVMNNCCLIVN